MKKDFYDIESEPIVSLEALCGPKKQIVDKCLVLFSKVIYDYMLEKYECRQIGEINGCNGNTKIYSFNHNGEEIGFYLTGIGSSICAGNVMVVNHFIGATKFVLFGSCGSLDYEKTNGKYVIPTQAYRGEGMSFYFKPASEYIDIKNADRVEEIFTELHLPFVKGRVWTTDCMFRETVNLVNDRKKEGCIAVEMELAGVQSVCDFYGFELYDFLISGDVLSEDGYETEGLQQANHNFDGFGAALKLLERI